MVINIVCEIDTIILEVTMGMFFSIYKRVTAVLVLLYFTNHILLGGASYGFADYTGCYAIGESGDYLPVSAVYYYFDFITFWGFGLLALLSPWIIWNSLKSTYKIIQQRIKHEKNKVRVATGMEYALYVGWYFPGIIKSFLKKKGDWQQKWQKLCMENNVTKLLVFDSGIAFYFWCMLFFSYIVGIYHKFAI